MTNKMITSIRTDESDDDDENEVTDATPLHVETRLLQNTEVKINLHATAQIDLGSMVNNNKNMPDVD